MIHVACYSNHAACPLHALSVIHAWCFMIHAACFRIHAVRPMIHASLCRIHVSCLLCFMPYASGFIAACPMMYASECKSFASCLMKHASCLVGHNHAPCFRIRAACRVIHGSNAEFILRAFDSEFMSGASCFMPHASGFILRGLRMQNPCFVLYAS